MATIFKSKKGKTEPSLIKHLHQLINDLLPQKSFFHFFLIHRSALKEKLIPRQNLSDQEDQTTILKAVEALSEAGYQAMHDARNQLNGLKHSPKKNEASFLNQGYIRRSSPKSNLENVVDRFAMEEQIYLTHRISKLNGLIASYNQWFKPHQATSTS